jgi:ABC-type uncharacterized transport system involved in gliding motility auxiliary subunit
MKKTLTYGGLILGLILFVAFNSLSGAMFKSSRLDLTDEKLYTLSEGTKNILRDLKEDITLRLFFSKKVAKDVTPVVGYAQRVQELLQEYALHAGGRIKVEVLDPEPYSEEEEKAVSFGLQGAPLNAAGDLVYFGIAGTNSTDEKEVIPFVQQNRESFLEYDLTRLVYTLANTKKQVVGVISKLPMEGNPMARMRNPQAEVQDWFILDQMRERFEVRMIPPTSETIESGIDVLMVVHPQGLSPALQYAIDQFVLAGGKALVFVDPFCDEQEVPNDPQNPLQGMMADRSSDLGPLLSAWGVDYNKDQLVGDLDNGLRVRLPQGGEADYIVWLGLRGDADAIDKTDTVTAQLDTINMATAGFLTKRSDATTTVTALLQSSKNTQKLEKTAIQFGPDPKKLLEAFQSGGERLMIAARINGPAKSAFPDGKPAAADGTAPPADPAALKESKGPINVIVVADADLLADKWWTRMQNFFGQRLATPTADNNGLVLNSLENLSGNNDLISLRGRGNSQRPFEKVNEIRKEADKRFLAKEQQLQQKLDDLKGKLADLQKGKSGAEEMILSAEQRSEIEKFRDEQVVTTRELRRVKLERNKEIEALGTRIKLTNTFLVPLLVILAAVGLASLRPKPKGG